MSESRGGDADDADEWAISLEDLEEGDESGGNAGYEPRPIEAGDPTLEGVAFVLLGVVLTLAVLLAGI